MKHYKDKNGNFYGIEKGQTIPDGYTEVTLDEINQANEAKAQAEFDALPYSQKRAAEYPPITDYIDGIVKGDDAQVQAYIDACLAVKDKYPKP